jgi:hypothetical protein
MTQKTEGYIELEWTCPNCQSNNPGPVKTCQNCGGAQPADITFHLPGEAILKNDEAIIRQAEAGPDVHCPYCGSRNSSIAKVCTQCGGDLTGAVQRISGQVVGAYTATSQPPVPCPNCGELNSPGALSCQKCGAPMNRPPVPPAPITPAPKPKRNPLVTGLTIFLIIAFGCGFLVLLFSLFKTESMVGTVEQPTWNRAIAIEAIRTVKHQDWKSDLPSNVVVGSCVKKYHNTQDQPAPVATEVCGTSYVVDKGSGIGKVVKDCTYQVYQDYCEYIAQEWQVVDQVVLNGSDSSPRWPDLRLSSDQRAGAKKELYAVQFNTSKGLMKFTTSDSSLFVKCLIGTTWNLEVNRANEVVSISAPK